MRTEKFAEYVQVCSQFDKNKRWFDNTQVCGHATRKIKGNSYLR